MKAKELRELTNEELKHKLVSLKEELFNLRKSIYTAKLEKPHRIKEIRKDIARILTILNEREKE
ncbi:MAG: 50S ribosomal protein L29 [Candidatus Omnitrophota bacterium]